MGLIPFFSLSGRANSYVRFWANWISRMRKRTNCLKKHGIDFETAMLVFNDVEQPAMEKAFRKAAKNRNTQRNMSVS